MVKKFKTILDDEDIGISLQTIALTNGFMDFEHMPRMLQNEAVQLCCDYLIASEAITASIIRNAMQEARK